MEVYAFMYTHLMAIMKLQQPSLQIYPVLPAHPATDRPTPSRHKIATLLDEAAHENAH
jgi:hypothetical protein